VLHGQLVLLLELLSDFVFLLFLLFLGSLDDLFDLHGSLLGKVDLGEEGLLSEIVGVSVLGLDLSDKLLKLFLLLGSSSCHDLLELIIGMRILSGELFSSVFFSLLELHVNLLEGWSNISVKLLVHQLLSNRWGSAWRHLSDLDVNDDWLEFGVHLRENFVLF